jgi:hypothetical protein
VSAKHLGDCDMPGYSCRRVHHRYPYPLRRVARFSRKSCQAVRCRLPIAGENRLHYYFEVHGLSRVRRLPLPWPQTIRSDSASPQVGFTNQRPPSSHAMTADQATRPRGVLPNFRKYPHPCALMSHDPVAPCRFANRLQRSRQACQHSSPMPRRRGRVRAMSSSA